jgi:hypothetical protein
MEYRQPLRLWPAWFFHAGCKLNHQSQTLVSYKHSVTNWCSESGNSYHTKNLQLLYNEN